MTHQGEEDEGAEKEIDIDTLELPPLPEHIQALLTPKYRLVITKIEINNFKSFAGRIQLDQFDEHFTCIIGPNGSGKSNVIDSLLFVIGHRASKMRGAKLSTLLHNSAECPNVKSCSVTVHFEAIAIEGDKEKIRFSITRIAFPDNSSHYKINEKQVSLKDVTKLLREYGVDLDHSRYLILQGDVESIAMMKPIAANEHEQGFLEYLEDIIGTERFKKPLELLNLKVEELSAMWAEKKNRVKAAQNEVQQLDGPYQQALEFIKCDNDYKLAKSKMLQLKRFELGDQEISLTVKYTDREEKMKESNEQCISKKHLCKQSQDELNRLQKSYDKNNNELTKLKKCLVDYETEDGTIRHEIKTSFEQEKKYEKQNEQELSKVQTWENIPNEKLEEINKAEDDLKIAENQQEQFEIVLNKLKQDLLPQTEQWRKDLTDKTNNCNRFKQDKYANKKKDYELAQNRLQLLLSEEERHKNTLNEMKNDYDNKQKELNIKQEKFHDIDQQLNHTEKLHQEKGQLLKDIEEEYSIIDKRFRQNQLELNNINSQMQTTQSRDRTLNFLLGQKQQGKLQGFHQRLGALASIDSKYDVAISTAVGGYLDYYVVDDVRSGESAKNLLKEHKQGTGSFICMDKMLRHSQQANRRFDVPQLAPNTYRLFDLIDINDSIYKNTFYYVLRDTLVVDNIDDAQKVAFGSQTRYRVVTLEGETIEQSGTMAGGGSFQARGKMILKTADNRTSRQSIHIDPAKKNQLEKSVKEDGEKLTELEQQRFQLTTQEKQLKQKLADEKRIHTQIKNDLKNLPNHVETLKASVEKQQKLVESKTVSTKDREKYDEELKQTKQEYDAANDELEELKAAIDVVTKRINDHNKLALAQPQTDLDNAIKQVKKLQNIIDTANVEITNARRNLKKSQDKIKANQTAIDQILKKRGDLNTRLEKLEELANNADQKKTQIENDLETNKINMAELRETIRITEAELADIEKEIVHLKHEYEAAQKELAQCRHEISVIDVEINGLRLSHVIDDEEDISDEAASTNYLKEVPIQKYDRTDLDVYTMKDLVAATLERENELKQTHCNLTAIGEHRRAVRNLNMRQKDLVELETRRDHIRAKRDRFNEQRQTEFRAGFDQISRTLKHIYRTITDGGDAELEFCSSNDPFVDGVELSIRPPKKSWKRICNLSGGEKTLSSLAFVFALHTFRPTPIYVMDEIDAALDFKNVSIVGRFIKERTKNAQFIVISLRENMFTLADYLIGIYKVNNCSQTASLRPALFAKKLEERKKSHLICSQEQTNPSHNQDENDVTMTEHSDQANTYDTHSTSIHQNQTTMSDNNGF
ncbi:unnamed protein product [Rotaria sordida]|uniref:Structural maintenance of chromosomes protein n=1 Tax=Rotaria sordida TaxID=392033 RepID=A0A815DRI8_9BILA|nr:unnamed protein product [Rotaria sordida]CAF3772753.1 unnamed protein product [Rotaria sordida]